VQRLLGNQEVARVIQRAGTPHKPPVEQEEDPLEGSEKAKIQRVAVDYPLDKKVSFRSKSKPSTTVPHTPKFKGSVSEDAANDQWKYKVDSIKSKGKIRIVYYPKKHYPAPTPSDDSGALKNVKKSNVDDMIQDMKDNRQGIFDYWGAYRAEDDHEAYHWETEWKDVSRPKFAEAETQMNALAVAKSDAKTQSKAKRKLEKDAKKIFLAKVKEMRQEYFALGDSPGDPPYIAQAPAVDNLRARVEGKKVSEGW
jgi:hypothetical protein